jgi:hypothetical protein
MKSISCVLVLVFLTTSSTFAQSTIPSEYRGGFENVARGVLEGNNIEIDFRNHGEFREGAWRNGGEGKYIDGIGFIVAAKVVGERAKWAKYYGEDAVDTTLTPVIINFRAGGLRSSPYTGNFWGWLPLNGFLNTDRVDQTSSRKKPLPANSADPTSWPAIWPDKLDQTDAGWSNVWNGYRGKGIANGAQETIYVMDDHSDHEYSFGIEVEGPHSSLGVYHPSISDSSIGGLGLQTEVRTFQFNDPIGNDILFTHHRTTNVSEKDLNEVWTSMIIDVGLGQEEDDEIIEFEPEKNTLIFSDKDGSGGGSAGQPPYDLGSFAFILLEQSTNESNRFDDDNDGIIDESKFNGPGEYIEGKAEIDAYLASNYNMNRFSQVHIDLEEFPAYRNERWWTGDEDLDWIAYDDFNNNGLQDSDEPLKDDVGRDGLGPEHENYTGPDEGEGDGIPTQGEPNFGELDMLEAENIGMTLLDIKSRPYYESYNNLRNDSWLFERILAASENIEEYKETLDTPYEPYILLGTGPFELKKDMSTHFITALVFAETREELEIKIEQTLAIYESDYGQSMFLTHADMEEVGIPNQISLFQNYPNPFNPNTTIQFSLDRTDIISLSIYDITGRLIKEVIKDQNYSAGTHKINFEANNLSSGLYLYQLKAGDKVFTKKLTLIK